MNKQLILVGGGGHCKSVIDVVESIGYSILGILDVPENVGKPLLDYTIIGTDEQIPEYVNQADFLVTVGQIKSAALRIKIHDKIVQAGGKLATIVAPTAHVSKYAQVGAGSVIMHHTFVNANAVVGTGCIVNTYASIEHDVVVGNFCHLATGVIVNGSTHIGNNCFVGSRSVISNNLSICDNVLIGAGTVLIKDVSIPGTYAGNTARKISEPK
jgi:sugar O-acyltransferase (sialic acid O-acetyltransferase NeuD family)